MSLLGWQNPSRVRLEAWLAGWAARLPEGSRVLDAGAGKAPYRHLFEHTHYEWADFMRVEHKEYAQPTYVCDLSAIPVQDEVFDCIVCTQTLEHVPEPQAVMRELYRVLKPGGTLLVSAPLFYEEHEQPYDYFRYTQFGLTRLAEDAGFHVDEIERLEGYFGTLAYQHRMAAKELPVRTLHARGLRLVTGALKLQSALLAHLFARLELHHLVTDAGMCKNYRCVFTKAA